MSETRLQLSGHDYLWDRSGEPDPLVVDLERTLAPLAYRELPPRIAIKQRTNWRMLRAAAAIGLLALGTAWLVPRSAPLAWQVVALRGLPQIGTSTATDGFLGIGQWIETDDHSQARLTVADIGHVTVQPNTRLRLVASGPTAPGGAPEHRLDLARGAISAFITAPPRLFFVNTPAALAVDYGCAYSLTVEGDGSGLLSVDRGLVMLEGGGRTVIVPMNAHCRMREGVGPGTPFSDHASAALQAALDESDFGQDSVEAFNVVLAECTNMDTVTLWHLLERSPPRSEGRMLASSRLMEFVPLPKDVTVAQIESNDVEAMRQWQAEVQRYW